MLVTKVSDILCVEDISPTRSQSIHLTDILNAVGMKLGFIKTSKKSDDIDNDHLTRNNYFETGFTVERMLELALGSRLGYRPGELSLDGIACTPDGILYHYKDTGKVAIVRPSDFTDTFNILMPEIEPTVVEIKCTWMSVREPDTIWKWMAQIMGYCKVVGTCEAILHVLWINGSYKPPKPIYAQYLITFTQQEIDENWIMILNNKKLLNK